MISEKEVIQTLTDEANAEEILDLTRKIVDVLLPPSGMIGVSILAYINAGTSMLEHLAKHYDSSGRSREEVAVFGRLITKVIDAWVEQRGVSTAGPISETIQ